MWAAFILTGLPVTQARAADSPVAAVTGLTGQASIIRVATGKESAAAPGRALFLKDVTRTGQKSRLEMKFVDGSVVAVGAKTRLIISSYMFDPKKKVRKTLLNLVTGAIKFTTSKLMGYKDKRFQVTTPTATCGVRSTSVEILYDPVSQETIVVNTSQDGSKITIGLLSDPKKQLVLEPGQAIVVTRTGFRKATKKDLNKLRLRLRLQRALQKMRQRRARRRFIQGRFGPGSRLPSRGGRITPGRFAIATSSGFYRTQRVQTGTFRGPTTGYYMTPPWINGWWVTKPTYQQQRVLITWVTSGDTKYADVQIWLGENTSVIPNDPIAPFVHVSKTARYVTVRVYANSGVNIQAMTTGGRTGRR